jgi:hypothetical protein
MTLLKSFQRGGVNDLAEISHEIFELFPRGNRFSGVNDHAKSVSAWALTPLKFEYCQFFRRILGHMQNGFSP